jgi:hypothetical protein
LLTEKKKRWFELITGAVALLNRQKIALMLVLQNSHRPESEMKLITLSSNLMSKLISSVP